MMGKEGRTKRARLEGEVRLEGEKVGLEDEKVGLEGEKVR